jgi:hypothetical protein
LITKEVATISGVAFTLVFFLIFVISEHINKQKEGAAAHVELDQFQIHSEEKVSKEGLGVRPGNTLCFVRDYHTLNHLCKALEVADTEKRDFVVMTVEILKGPDTGYEGIAEHQLFTSYKQLLFTHVVALAEKEGKTVHLLVVPSSNILDAIVLTAARLDSAEIIAAPSPTVSPEEQAKRFRKAWKKLRAEPKHQICFRIIDPDGNIHDFRL